MSKMRVHELAKELGMENKELMEILEKKNLDIKSPMSSLEENVVEEIKKEAGKKRPRDQAERARQEIHREREDKDRYREAVRQEAHPREQRARQEAHRREQRARQEVHRRAQRVPQE